VGGFGKKKSAHFSKGIQRKGQGEHLELTGKNCLGSIKSELLIVIKKKGSVTKVLIQYGKRRSWAH